MPDETTGFPPDDTPILTGLPGGFLTGVLDGWHAIPLDAMQYAAQVRDATGAAFVTIAEACCGLLVRVAPKYGGYDRGTVPVSHDPCQVCAWTVAAATGLLYSEADRLIPPPGSVRTAMTRILPDPNIAVTAARRIITAGGGDDGDGPAMIQLLAAVAAHVPVLLVSEECSEGECEHDDGRPCTFQDASAGCAMCSLTAGSWAGEWEGQFRGECRIEAPCQVLTALSMAALDMEAVARLGAETLARAQEIAQGGRRERHDR